MVELSEIKDYRNTVKNKLGIEVFNINQRFLLPINDSENGGSVTYITVEALPDCPVERFYWAVRRWLKASGIDVVQYCYHAALPEFCCNNVPKVPYEEVK